MDGFSGAASAIAVIEVSAIIILLCLQYSTAIKASRKDIEHFQRKVSSIKNVFEQVKQLLDRRDKTLLPATHHLSDLLKECFLQLHMLNTQLEPSKTHKTMSRVRVQDLKWSFRSKEVEKYIDSLKSYEQN